MADTNYKDMQLNAYLFPVNSAFNAGTTISAYDFASMMERGAVSSFMISELRSAQGSVILDNLGLGNSNFTVYGTAVSPFTGTYPTVIGTAAGDPYTVLAGTSGTMQVTFNLKKKVQSLVLGKASIAVLSDSSILNYRVAVYRSGDGTAYSLYSNLLDGKKYFNDGTADRYELYSTWDTSLLDGSGTFNYWKVALEWIIYSYSGTTVGTAKAQTADLQCILLGS